MNSLKYIQTIDGWLLHHTLGYNMLSLCDIMTTPSSIVNMVTLLGFPRGERNHITCFSSMRLDT